MWGALEPVDNHRPIILVMAQMDANSIFQDLAIGGEAAGNSYFLVHSSRVQVLIKHFVGCSEWCGGIDRRNGCLGRLPCTYRSTQ